jgi:flavin reductase (DIM6/NTAB) family NADH-FMN oxidoreductase RutF
LRLPSGVSGLACSVAVFDCEVEECIERHNHAIVIGRVRRALLGDGSREGAAGFARRGEHMGVGLVGRTLGSIGMGSIGPSFSG